MARSQIEPDKVNGLNHRNGSQSGFKDKLAVASAWLPVGAWHALCGRPLILPYYHMVSDETVPHVRPLYRYKNIAQFKHDLEFFLAHFRSVGLDDLLKHLLENRPLPQRGFLLSFDDGFREMAEIVAPILKAKGVSATFFLNSAFVDNRELGLHQKAALLIGRLAEISSAALEEKIKRLFHGKGIVGDEVVSMLKLMRYADRAVLDEAAALCDLRFDEFLQQQKPYLTSGQIRGLLRDGFTIGGHSLDHPFYGDLTLEEQLRQTRESVNILQDKFGAQQRAFAFPHSDAGVSRTFFERSFSDGTLQISFGTGGLLRDAWTGHFQRFSMEKAKLPPATMVARQYARRFLRRVAGTDLMVHPV
jgi:peptidoglycan/xylan/chitin deacetylase (PgdA/CDA1 family)